MSTAADLIRRHANVDAVGLFIQDSHGCTGNWSRKRARRAALFDEVLDPEQPPHVGAFLEWRE